MTPKIDVCLTHDSIAVIKHHEQINLQKKAFTCGHSFRGFESMAVMAGREHGNMQAGMALGYIFIPGAERTYWEWRRVLLKPQNPSPPVTHLLQQDPLILIILRLFH